MIIFTFSVIKVEKYNKIRTTKQQAYKKLFHGIKNHLEKHKCNFPKLARQMRPSLFLSCLVSLTLKSLKISSKGNEQISTGNEYPL